LYQPIIGNWLPRVRLALRLSMCRAATTIDGR